MLNSPETPRKPAVDPDTYKIIWQPLKGTSQEFAITSPAKETLYCGTRGNGKTDVQIFKFAKNVGKGYGMFYRGIIFDREYKNLDDIVTRTKRWFKQIWGDRVQWLANKADYKWVWDTGEELLIRTMKTIEDYDDYHGQEYPFIGWNELTKYPDKECYESMLSCNRTSFVAAEDSPDPNNPLPELPLEIFSTTNPYGVGRGWVKRRFIDGYPYGVLQKTTQKLFDPRTQERIEYTSTRVAIFGHYKENRKLPVEYIASLGSLTNKNKRAAWLEGRWDVASGGVFEECWDEDVHILPDFTVPASWEVFPTFDWGSSAPFYVGWWAVTSGEECYIPNTQGTFDIVTFPANTLILVHEWYGSDGDGKGTKIGATAIAQGMNTIEDQMYQYYYLQQGCVITVGDADGQIFNKINSDDPTIAEWFLKEGVEWNRADKSQGSRKNGLALLIERMLASLKRNGRPAFYVMRRNKHFVDLVPTLPPSPKDPDDVDTEAEDHPYDATRYATLRVSNQYATNINEMGAV